MARIKVRLTLILEWLRHPISQNRWMVLTAWVAISTIGLGGLWGSKLYSDKLRDSTVNACEDRNRAWNRTMDWLIERSDDDTSIETLRQLGVVDCEQE